MMAAKRNYYSAMTFEQWLKRQGWQQGFQHIDKCRRCHSTVGYGGLGWRSPLERENAILRSLQVTG